MKKFIVYLFFTFISFGIQSADVDSVRLISIVESVNSSEELDKSNIYNDLAKVLEKKGNNTSYIKAASKFNESLWAKSIDDKVIISTVDQYKLAGFVLIFDSNSEELLFFDKEFSLGIREIKVINTISEASKYWLMINYISQSGSGVYAESVRIYAVENDQITLALDKPCKESVSMNWDAYETDVFFEQTNEIALVEDKVELLSTGYVTITHAMDDEEKIRLSDERYEWDAQLLKFIQVEGRSNNGTASMSDIYADYANPKGKWFQQPENIQILNLKD